MVIMEWRNWKRHARGSDVVSKETDGFDSALSHHLQTEKKDIISKSIGD
jgi:hypothetical protein